MTPGELSRAIDLRPRRNWRTTKNTVMTCVLAAALLAVAIPLIAVLYAVISRGAHAVGSLDFFTAEIPVSSRKAGPGMGPAIVGTLLATGGATLIAVPLGVLGAVYLHEYGGTSRFARVVRFLAMVMTGVPSIVMGLFVYVTWTIANIDIGDHFDGNAVAVVLTVVGGAVIAALGISYRRSRRASLVPRPVLIAAVVALVIVPVLDVFLFSHPQAVTFHIGGYSAFGGALGLACLMLPVVINSTEQMLRLVPNQLREGAFALGATKSRVIVSVVLPAALPGIVSGALLAVARAAGETAPLLFTIGAETHFNKHLFSGANTALSVQIFSNANSVFEASQDRAWGAALTLVALTFAFTLVARLFTRLALRR
jgi:ABC-type phosphate transport system permease subunit